MKQHSKNFKNLFYSQFFANTGDILYIVGLISYVYTVTKSATSSALIPVIITIGIFINFLLRRMFLLFFNLLKQLLCY